MLGMDESEDMGMGESLLEIESPLDIPQDILYHRGEANLSGSYLSGEDRQDSRSEKVHAQIMNELNEVCDVKSQTSKHKRRHLDHGDSTRSRKSSRSQEETSIGVDDRSTLDGLGENDTALQSTRQRAKPKHLCQECGKTFKRAHNLKIHGRLHSGDKPYGCPFPDCRKEFRWKSSIVSHLNWHRTKKGDVLPGNFANMHALILKKKKNEAVELEIGPPKQEEVGGRDAFNDVEREGDECDKDSAGRIEKESGIGHMDEMTSFASGLGEVGMDYKEDIVEKDDATVLTPSTTSYQASPVGIDASQMGELDCLPVLDEKEWETRSEGCRSGLSGVLLPSLSCCQIESEGDGFGSFLEEN